MAKGLEAFKQLIKGHYLSRSEYEVLCGLVERELKALEIIRLKEIDTQDIIYTTDDYDVYVAYCEGNGYTKEYICDKEEFELLREVLENE